MFSPNLILTMKLHHYNYNHSRIIYSLPEANPCSYEPSCRKSRIKRAVAL